MRQTLKNKKGMTMMELLVGLLMFAMIGAAVSVIVAPTMRASMGAHDMAENNTLLARISSELTADMKSAVGPDGLEVTAGGTLTIRTHAHTIVYDADGGFLRRNGLPVFDEGYYGGRTIALTFLDRGGAAVTGSVPYAVVRVTLFPRQAGDPAYSRDYAVRPLGTG